MSNMMRHSTRRSLCLVDEFGKGTNAQDGISFLYACLRHFLDRGRECPRLLACTHYTELLELPELVDRALRGYMSLTEFVNECRIQYVCT